MNIFLPVVVIFTIGLLVVWRRIRSDMTRVINGDFTSAPRGIGDTLLKILERLLTPVGEMLVFLPHLNLPAFLLGLLVSLVFIALNKPTHSALATSTTTPTITVISSPAATMPTSTPIGGQ